MDALSSDSLRALQLHISSAGYARVTAPWHGTVTAPPCSRLYFIEEGGFRITGSDGTVTELCAPACWLLPSGYSFRFRCDTSMDHTYFHLRLTDVDGLDLLSALPRPVSAPLYPPADPQGIHTAGSIAENLRCLSAVYGTLAALLDANHIRLSQPHYSPEIRLALETVRRRLSVQLTAAEIAREVHLAVSTLQRNFRRETGMSIGEYTHSLIMQQAHQLLLSTDLPIAAISERFGFCDQFYFSRRFREKFGMPPSRLRMQPRI